VFAQVEVPVQKRRVLSGRLQRKVTGTPCSIAERFQPPDKQRFRSSNGLKRKSCTKRRMRQRSEKSHAHELAAVEAAIRRGKNFQTRCWRDPALLRRGRKPNLESAAAIGLLLRVRHGSPC